MEHISVEYCVFCPQRDFGYESHSTFTVLSEWWSPIFWRFLDSKQAVTALHWNQSLKVRKMCKNSGGGLWLAPWIFHRSFCWDLQSFHDNTKESLHQSTGRHCAPHRKSYIFLVFKAGFLYFSLKSSLGRCRHRLHNIWECWIWAPT